MYAKHDAAAIRQEFWANLGRYMAPVCSSAGEKINWINYKTGEKNIIFRLQADHHSATIAIEVTHKDAAICNLYYGRLLQLRKLWKEVVVDEWIWMAPYTNENGKNIGRIFREISPVNIYSRDDWPALISFFKPRLIALDAFWNQGKHGFESLS